MKTALLLLGGFLCGLHGAEGQDTPDLLSMITKLQTEVQALKTQDQSHQTEVQALKTQIQNLENSQAQLQNRSPLAFFATLSGVTNEGIYGPFGEASSIKYSKVVTNVGNGYNAATGKFTASLKGLYVFTFSAPRMVSTVHLGLLPILVPSSPVLKRNTGDIDASFPNAGFPDTRVAVVTLEVGDTVHVEIRPSTTFANSEGPMNSFSGFLLSPL